MRRLMLVAAGVWVLGSGCAHEGSYVAQEGTGGYLTLRHDSGVVEARIEGNRIQGPEVNVTLTGEDVMRGHAFGETLELSWTPETVRGFLGSGRVELTLAPEDGTLVMRGIYGGRQSVLRVRSSSIEGNIGACSYSLHSGAADGYHYEGQRTCGTAPQRAFLNVPPDLDQRPLGEFAAILALLLGG